MKKDFNNAFCAVRPPGHHAEKQKAMGMYMSQGFGTTADMKEKGVYAITAKVLVGDVRLMDKFDYEIK